MRIKDIVGFEGLYAVTDDGQIIRLYRVWNNERGWCNMRPSAVLACPKDARGRRQVRLFARDGRYRRAKVYQLVAEAFVPPYSGELVNHIDGNSSNDHYANLEWATTAGNLMHGQLRKAHVQITAAQITEVRQLYGTVPVKVLSERYKIDRSTIHRIMFGKNGRRRSQIQ